MLGNNNNSNWHTLKKTEVLLDFPWISELVSSNHLMFWSGKQYFVNLLPTMSLLLLVSPVKQRKHLCQSLLFYIYFIKV